jgi:hypothetical protein
LDHGPSSIATCGLLRSLCSIPLSRYVAAWTIQIIISLVKGTVLVVIVVWCGVDDYCFSTLNCFRRNVSRIKIKRQQHNLKSDSRVLSSVVLFGTMLKILTCTIREERTNFYSNVFKITKIKND